MRRIIPSVYSTGIYEVGIFEELLLLYAWYLVYYHRGISKYGS